MHLDINGAEPHDDLMRTTLTLEPDVAERIKQETRRTGKGMKVLVNEALRMGLGLAARTERPPKFEVQPHSFGLRPGIDRDRMNQLLDEMEVEETARKLSR